LNRIALCSIPANVFSQKSIQILLPTGYPRGMRVADITKRIFRVIEVPRAYIGQSGNVGNRLVQHNQNNDFWNRALFLEWFAIAEATKAGRYSLENGNTGSQPYTPAPLQADCHEIHETAATLLATLGQPIFEPLTNAPTAKGEAELFHCKGSGADGVGEYTTEGFVVLKGSKGRIENVAVMMGRSANGWVEWKAANGKTLDELKRQAVAAVG